jgi:hypothetical protein
MLVTVEGQSIFPDMVRKAGPFRDADGAFEEQVGKTGRNGCDAFLPADVRNRFGVTHIDIEGERGQALGFGSGISVCDHCADAFFIGQADKCGEFG